MKLSLLKNFITVISLLVPGTLNLILITESILVSFLLGVLLFYKQKRTQFLKKNRRVLNVYEEQNRKFAEEINSIKNKDKELFGKINFELRTSVNSIQGMIAILNDTELTKKQQDCIAVINKYSLRCLTGMEDVLNDKLPAKNNLPMPQQAKPQTAAAAQAVQSLSASFADKFPMKILVAEDDNINRIIAGKMFEKLGYAPDFVKDGQEALDVVTEDNYDIIFMDIKMPVMDGREATRMMRVCLTKQPIIIALTASVLNDEKENCLKDGMNDFITKPLQINILAEMLEKWHPSESLANIENETSFASE
jgi:CheY-like chemotaxis protein